jgi:hypothetical protein
LICIDHADHSGLYIDRTPFGKMPELFDAVRGFAHQVIGDFKHRTFGIETDFATMPHWIFKSRVPIVFSQ